MKTITVRSVQIDEYDFVKDPKTGVPVQVFEDNGSPKLRKRQYTTGELLDEYVWAAPEFSADEAGAICLERCADKIADAEEGATLEIDDADHAAISKKLKEWFPKNQQGQQGAGNRTTRRVRQLANSFIYGYGNGPKKNGDAKALPKPEAAPALPAHTDES